MENDLARLFRALADRIEKGEQVNLGQLGLLNWNERDQTVEGLQKRSFGGRCTICNAKCWELLFGMPAAGKDIDEFKKSSVSISGSGNATLISLDVKKGQTLALQGWGWEREDYDYEVQSAILTINDQPVEPYNNVDLKNHLYGGVATDEMCQCHVIVNGGQTVAIKLYSDTTIASVDHYARLKGILFDVDCE